MSVQLNHTIVRCRDQLRSAQFVAWLLGMPEPKPFGPFHVIELDNGVSLDFLAQSGEFSAQHYAFLVSESEFDAIFVRLGERNIRYWADPAGRRENQVNRNDGGRGLYFQDLDGHWLELITRPYGG